MSLEDPFFVVKGEVQKAVASASSLYHRWCELLQDTYSVSKEEYDWTTNELRNSLRSIEWDLEDLDETIGIVESNPRKFKIETGELLERKAFVVQTRQTVKNLFGGIDPLRKPADRYQRLDQELEIANSQYIEEQQVQQRLIADQQDQQLELVSGSIGVLKNMSNKIGDELDEQAVMLDEFSHEMDSTHSRLDTTLKKLANVSHMTSARRQWCVIIVLLVILVVVLILLFAL
ncbi:syntaxin-6-like isoform X2 [Mobula birostris]|uniref:syntaxin-6-like isoform X2 n=1 Tax=Mobula birostris TaxID=1983395 RepID=UPI003B28D429